MIRKIIRKVEYCDGKDGDVRELADEENYVVLNSIHAILQNDMMLKCRLVIFKSNLIV